MAEDTLYNPIVKNIPTEAADDTLNYNLVAQGDPTGGGQYRPVSYVPQVYAPVARVHVVQDAVYNADGKLLENGTANRPYVARSTNDLRTILDAIPADSSVLLGPGEYNLDDQGDPGVVFVGYSLRKNMILEGSGRDSTVIKFVDNMDLNSRVVPCTVLGVGDLSGRDPIDVTLANFRIDANFQGIDLDPLGTASTLAMYFRTDRGHVEALDVINCGTTLAGEQFAFWMGNRAAGLSEYTMKNVKYFSEQARDGTVHQSLSAVPVGDTGGLTSITVEDLNLIKNVGGIGMPYGGVDKFILKGSRIDGSALDALGGGSWFCTPTLHDTSDCNHAIIEGNYFRPQINSYAAIHDMSGAVDSGRLDYRNNIIEVAGGSFPAARIGLTELTRFYGNQYLGGPVFADAFTLNNVAPGTQNVHVYDNVFGNATYASLDSGLVALAIARDNKLEDGTAFV